MANCKVIAVTNQKGGVGKTTTTANLGIGLAQQNKRVLLIDADAQGSLTLSLGYPKPDELPVTLADIMQNVIDDTPIPNGCSILHHGEGVDLLPANIELSGMEIRLINAMSRESVLRTYINAVKPHYDYILIDCMPSLGMMPINSLAAADSVIIPSQPSFLSAKGLDLLILSDEKHPIVFEYAGQDTALVEIKANGGAPIENKLLYGEIHGLKKDEDGSGLADALIGLFRADCTEFTTENAILTATSAEDGSFYIQHNNLSAGTRTFKPGTHGAEFVPEMKVVSDHIFTKSKSSALTNDEFAAFIKENSIDEFYVAGADAAACIKSTCYNMTKSGYAVHVLSDCITSYDKKKLPELLAYYESKGCTVLTLQEAVRA